MSDIKKPVLRYRIEDAPKRSRSGLILRLVLFLFLTGGVSGVVVGTALYLHYAPTLPSFESIDDYRPKIGSRIYSSSGQLVGEFAEERRVIVEAEQVPSQLFHAFIAAEDKRFFVHSGIDYIGVAQAIVDKLRHPGQKLRGASTISQQVAKSFLASAESYASATERSLVRKIREAILAKRLESSLTKEEILFLYVNQIYLGHKAYGVQAAAEHYFRKNVWEMNLAEMATLAGLPQRPSDYSPFSRPKAAKARRTYVLRRMLAEGYIDQAQHDEALAFELTVYPRVEAYLEMSPYYTEQVRRELLATYGERTLLEEGLQVYTGLDIEKQARARRAVTRGLYELDRRQGFRGPLAKLDSTPLRKDFIRLYRKELKLEEGAELSFDKTKVYLALVTGYVDSEEVVVLDVGGKEGLLPLAGMRWARKPDPMGRVDLHYVDSVRRVLKPGDVISVRLTTRKALGKDPHGWAAYKSVPTEGDIFMLEQEPIAQASLLSVDPLSGMAIAQVGGYDFDDSTFNRVVQACREPGSSFKPIVYSAAIDKLDYTPSTLIDDKPLVFNDEEMRWKPANAGLEFRGELPLRTCLKDSINTPAIRIANAVGIEDIIKNARRLGLQTPLKRELGTALGSSCTTLYDLIHVYTTINQYGVRRPVRFIKRVVDRFGNVLEDYSPSWDPALDLASRLDRAYEALIEPEARALDKQTAFIMISLLQNVVRNGTATRASHTGYPVAGKTGTTNDSFDGWFMGFTPKIVTGAWVGHDKKERPLGVSEYGGRTALPMWLYYMVPTLKDYRGAKTIPVEQGSFNPPMGVVRASIDPETGFLARPDSGRGVLEYYRAGTAPTEYTPDQKVFDAGELNPFEIDNEL